MLETALELQRLPPQNIEAEQMVLGAILIDNSSMSKAAELLRPEDFYKIAHGKIFSVMLGMQERGENIDLVTLPDRIKREQMDLASLGGSSYLAMLVSLVPTAANVKSHASIVRHKAQLRKIIHVATDAITASYVETSDANDISEKLLAEMMDARRTEGPAIVLQREFITDGFASIEHRYEAAKESRIIGIPTGFRDMDINTSGWQPWYIILAGRPGMGKTALAEHFISAAANHFLQQWEEIPEEERPLKPKGSVGFISIEMGKEPLALRALSRAADVPLSRLLAGAVHQNDWTHLGNAAGRLVKLPIVYQFSTPQASIIAGKIDEMIIKHGARIIGVDYIQLMEDHHKMGNREQEISSISRMIKHKVEQYNIPIIALAQLSRKLEDRPDKRPIPSDLRESGSLEQDADVILFIHREEVYKSCQCPEECECLCGRRGAAEVLCRKGRMIGTWKVPLKWNGKMTQFFDAYGASHP
jgi:replicative DNA helicase